MRPIMWWFLVVLNGAMSNGSGDSEHVHFKIHVPDIVKHQIHTKVIFVHVHKPKPKKKPAKKKPTETHHKEEHHDDWSSWSSYGHHEDHEDHQDKHSHEKNHTDSHKERKEEKIHQHDHQEDKHYSNSPMNSPKNEFHGGSHKYFPNHDYKENVNEHPENSKSTPHNLDSYFPQWNSYDAGQYRHSGHDWTPGRMLEFPHSTQYAVHENVKDTRSNEVDPYYYQYEKGYRKGLLSKTKHLFEDQTSKFEDSKHEEENESKESSEDESNERTHAGRYLIDDTEYEQFRNHRKDTDSLSRRHK